MRDISAGTDDDLLKRMWAGQEDAFLTLYRRHQSAVFRFASQMSGKAEIAEEVTQDVFMTLMRGPGQFDPARGSLGAFLYGVARNFVLRALERERMYVGDSDEDPAAGDDVLGDLTRAERVNALREAILTLPAPYREVVVLCELHEIDYAQAATALSCPVGTVRSRLHRARALLSSKLRAPEKKTV